jgi:uncharacterized protein (TIGR02145 family)
MKKLLLIHFIICVLSSFLAKAQEAVSFIDKRDGQSYKIITIGVQTWMAENLNFVTPDSWCYDYDEGNCLKYGRLYIWESAINACPGNWHLPSESEWITLEKYLGMTDKETKIFYYRGDGIGSKLKNNSSWEEVEGIEKGNNETGFSGMPGGFRIFYDSSFIAKGNRGSWWSSTKDGKYAIRRSLFSDKTGIDMDLATPINAFSVRCVKD